MKLSLLRPRSDSAPPADEVMAVYRRHAMRAMEEERWAAAEVFIDKMLDVDRRSTEAWLMKGHVNQYCRGRLERALECYRHVITLCGWDRQHRHVRQARSAIDRLLLHWS